MNLLYECRSIEIIEIGDENLSHFSYLIRPHDWYNGAECEIRGYKQWESDSYYCIATFQGTKCLMI